MIAIADNLNTRNRFYMEALEKKDKGTMVDLVQKVVKAGADIMNIQCSLDGAGDEKTLPWITGIISAETDIRLSLDSRNVEALKASLLNCRKPPLVNFLSETEPEDHSALLSLVAASEASLVIRASRGIIPNSIEAKLQILEGLIELANEADIPNSRLYADPSIVHMVGGMGQKNLANSYGCIKVLTDLIEPPVNTIAWVGNISLGIRKPLKKTIEASLLLYLAGAGLDAAMVDILDDSVRGAIYLIKSFRDEIVFTGADLAY
jgi:cobalamin-dependent methionine synthase I